MHKEDLISKLDLIPSEIIKSEQNYYLLFLYIGVILFIVLICYYYLKQRQLLKILKLIKKFETKPDFKILLETLINIKFFLASFNKNYTSFTERELVAELKSKNFLILANFFDISKDLQYQIDHNLTSNIKLEIAKITTQLKAEIKQFKNAKPNL